MGYLDALTSASLGSVGIGSLLPSLKTEILGSTSCGIALFPTPTTLDEEKQIDFYCTEGVIADVSNIVFGLIESSDQCQYIADVNFF